MTVVVILLSALLVAALSASPADSLTVKKPSCPDSCGGIDIPYPFGIGQDCFRKGFEISCINNDTTPVLAATSQAIQVLNLTVQPRPEARVMLPAAWQCYTSSGSVTSTFLGEVNINPDGVYRISNTHNQLVILGCNTFAYIKSGDPGKGGRYAHKYYTGCAAYSNDSRSARDGACAGVGCCHVDIPPELTDNKVAFESSAGWSHADQEFCPCDYAFIVDKDYYTFRVADLHMKVNTTMPLWLDWAIRDNGSMSCAAALDDKPGYACLSANSVCVDSTNGPGYSCNCTRGYEGNAYVDHGCNNINECKQLGKGQYQCYGICKDTQGDYECSCPAGYQSNDPRKERCTKKFPLAAQLAIGIILAICFVVVAALIVVIRLQERQLFKKNGGKKLENVESIMFFTKTEMKKITRNYSDLLGEGYFGKVYAGTLPDKDSTKVAVKTSVVVDKANVDEFTQEITIQSKMIHKNVLKLKGCCLEVKCPELVYEYAANGSLQEILHGKENGRILPLSLEQRLDIAIGSAQGLTYMHTHTGNNIIQHGDVKPGNILLDVEFVPKLADFGLSKLLDQGKQYAELVKGSMAYMDPVYHLTGRLTAASDVYSFGVVLLELFSRKPTVYDGHVSLIMEFQRLYDKENSARKMFDQEIVTEEDITVLEGIGRLAIECLERELQNRPNMSRVATRLMTLKDEWKHGGTNLTDTKVVIS